MTRFDDRPGSSPDDDPTRALDDFLQRMRPASAAPQGDDDLTDLSSLTARLHPEQAAPAERETRPKGGTLRNGERWQADDVTDVPVVELPRVAPVNPAAAADHDAVLQDIGRQARAMATQPAAGVDWQPDPHGLQLRPAQDARVLARWQHGAWIGAQRMVLQASTEFTTPAGAAPGAAPVVESHEAQRLLVLWAPPSPDAPHPGRWPRQVLLAAVGADAAAGALLAARQSSTPDADDALLWLDPDSAHVDWALAAEIALHHLPGLRPFQVDGLRAFIEAEREAAFARLNDGYVPAPGGAVQGPARPGRAA